MDLVLLVCLAAIPDASGIAPSVGRSGTPDLPAPTICHEERLAGSSALPMGCLSNAPSAIVEWTEDHPAWSVARWTCEPVERAARRARR
jgi:hypothetical protein